MQQRTSKLVPLVALLLVAFLPVNVAYSMVPLSTRRPISLTFSQAKVASSSTFSLFSDESSSSSDESSTSSDEIITSSEEPVIKKNAFSRFMGTLKPKSSDKMSTKELLAKMGLSTLLSYGWVSNMYNCVNVSLAWFAFTKKTGLSPLVPGQWKPFLAVYAGFYVISNFMRPFRIAVSIGVSKYFDLVISTIQDKIKVPRGVAIGITVFMFNIVGTCSFMALGVFTAATLSGVPVFVPKV
eukprot:scaffold10175_cov268-Chaetoceros_neogracile.AAC.1